MDCSQQAPLSMQFSRQEYWCESPCSPAGNFPHPETEPTSLMSPALAGRFFMTSTIWEAHSVQLSCVWFFVTPYTSACQASLSFTISQSLFKLMSFKSVMPFNNFILCCPLLLLPSVFPFIRVFFPVSQFFVSGGQRTGASASTSVLPKNIQNVFPLGLTGFIHLQSKGSPLSTQKWVNYSL